ncbi:cytochrome c oxidase assembly protein [Flexivirga caeni]|uniref:Cytochrome c oxidase assembly protein n=1 Tax=Flexivirga caeni TaxID=2294115 RepID=A0A3M9MHU6_9MICO|nr:cytochrome c oxidase assembly protein [Flexivirga caeni]RNI24755.1 hypothetical protein EFY87_03410 [Flexivirga caeni]
MMATDDGANLSRATHGSDGMGDIPTMPQHGGGMPAHSMTGMAPVWVLVPVMLLVTVSYGFAVMRLLRRGDDWPVARMVAFAAGVLTLSLALLPPLGDAMGFTDRILQHLLMAMLAPLAFAMSAPITLALRALPRAGRRRILHVLHSRVAHVWPCR